MTAIYKEVYKETDDDWHASYICGDIYLVSVVLLEYDSENSEAMYAINVSGNDDCEIVVEYKANDLESACSDFLDLIMKDKVNYEDVHELQNLRRN